VQVGVWNDGQDNDEVPKHQWEGWEGIV
jgi:hypothetical protein